MCVQAVRPGYATVASRGQQLDVNTALVDEVGPGDWVLVFLDAAREIISAERAAEVNATLDLLQAALRGGPAHEPAFELPSRLTAAQIAALAGAPT